MMLKEGLLLDRLVNCGLEDTQSWATVTPSFPLRQHPCALGIREFGVNTEVTITKGLYDDVLTSSGPPPLPFWELDLGIWQTEADCLAGKIRKNLPNPRFSVSSQTSSLSITWGLVRDTDQQAASQACAMGNSCGPAVCVFTSGQFW